MGVELWLSQEEVTRIEYLYWEDIYYGRPEVSEGFHGAVKDWLNEHMPGRVSVRVIDDIPDRFRSGVRTTYDFCLTFQSDADAVMFKLRWHSVWTGQAD